jgi:inner membrane protein
MDPVTHLAFGAALGQGCFHKQLGFRAALFGAVAAAAPDIDIVWMGAGDDFDALVLHRGITHSIPFQAVVGPLLGWVVCRWNGGTHLWKWIATITLALWSHAFLDWVTPYGTQLLQPFSDRRFASTTMPIIDPLYTLWLFLGLGIAWRLRAKAYAGFVSLAALVSSLGYIGYAAYLNDNAERFAERQLASEGVTSAAVTAYPTVLQVYLRRVVARTPTEDRVGYVNMWSPCPIRWGIATREHSVPVDAVMATREGKIFRWFAMDQVAATAIPIMEGWNVRVADLRYGIDNDPTDSIFSFDAPVHVDGTRVAKPYMREQVPDAARERITSAWDNVGCAL